MTLGCFILINTAVQRGFIMPGWHLHLVVLGKPNHNQKGLLCIKPLKPLKNKISLLLLGCRYVLPYCKINHYANYFILKVIQLLNS